MDKYKEGFDLLVHALPTKGKKLSTLPYLESLIASFELACDYFDSSNHPIFVFDQSEEPLFLENRAYIEQLSYPIVHLSTQEIIELARQKDVEGLIVTSKRDGFGYGGARNAVFLLAPLLYKEHTGKEAEFIHMGDDDIFVPRTATLVDALWAFEHRGQYSQRLGWVKGRFAQDSSFLKDDVLYNREKILGHCPWIEAPFVHGMAGLISSKKLCLNLPFGQEENHMLAIKSDFSHDREPLVHEGDARLPKKWLGDFLCERYVDMVERLLVTELIDPNNRYNICALPWNLREKPFSSFDEMVATLSSDETKTKMQEQFWKNIERARLAFSLPIIGPYVHSSQAMQQILDTDWTSEFTDLEKEEAEHLRAFYIRFAKEAACYKTFLFLTQNQHLGEAVSSFEKSTNRKIEECPLAYALYLFCKSLGLGEFCTLVGRLHRPFTL